MKQEDVDLLEAAQRLGHGLRRTGVVLIVCSAVATIGAALDSLGGTIVAAAALGLITANGLAMYAQASKLLKMIDKGVIEVLRSRGVR